MTNHPHRARTMTELIARIERVRVYPTGTNYRVAWKYLYNVTTSSGTPLIRGTDRLSIAERVARHHGYRPFRSWETE